MMMVKKTLGIIVCNIFQRFFVLFIVYFYVSCIITAISAAFVCSFLFVSFLFFGYVRTFVSKLNLFSEQAF